MLVFEYDCQKNQVRNDVSYDRENKRLSKRNRNLAKENAELRAKLEETTAELRKFNLTLADEINNRRIREEDIRYLSNHDVLTGLLNYRFYTENIDELDSEANLPISIIIGDVNNLKQINDTHGHAKGDELLQKAAHAIKSSCREGDIVVRLGGDEFLVILLKTTKSVASVIKRIIENTSKQFVSNQIVSISLGLDTKVDIGQDIDDTLKNAEKEMYTNKKLLKSNIGRLLDPKVK